MDYAALIAKVPQWMDLVGLILTGVVLLATVLVRVAEMMSSLEPKEFDPAHIVKAKAIVAQAGDWLGKILHYFPTLLKNPKTQQMENMIEQLQAAQSSVAVGLTVTKVEAVAVEVPEVKPVEPAN